MENTDVIELRYAVESQVSDSRFRTISTERNAMARWKKSLTAAATVAAACTVGALLTGFAPADADTAAGIQQTDLADAQELVAAIAPEVAEEGNPSADVTIEAGQEARSGDTVSPTAHVESPTPGVNGISVSVDYATGAPSTSGDFSVMQTSSPDAAAYVQPTSNGVRFLTAINSADAPSQYSYTFDVPVDTELVETQGGYRLEPPHRGLIRCP